MEDNRRETKTKKQDSPNRKRLRDLFELHSILRVHEFKHRIDNNSVCECGAVQNYYNASEGQEAHEYRPCRNKIYVRRDTHAKLTGFELSLYTKIKQIYGIQLIGKVTS